MSNEEKYREGGNTLVTLGEYGLHTFLEGLLNSAEKNKVIGDDCSIIEIPGMHDLVLLATTDRLPLNTSTANRARLCIAQNISDIVCMGGIPASFLVALTLPRNFTISEFQKLHYELKKEARKYGCAFVGGDTKEGPEFHMVGIALGFAKRSSLVTRLGAKPGSKIGVTCTKGKRWGLRWARAVVHAFDLDISSGLLDMLENANKEIDLPIKETRAAIGTNHILAGLDLSDGIAGALEILGRMNNVGFLLNEQALDNLAHPKTNIIAEKIGVSKSAFTLAPGYMWENLYCVESDGAGEVSTTVADVGGSFNIIGEVTSKLGIWLANGQSKRKIAPLSDEKFKSYPWVEKPRVWYEMAKKNGFKD